jgi:hypothetical protein
MTLSKTKLKKNETLLKVFLENYNHHRSTEPLPESIIFLNIFAFSV